jgi:hypothetical protein
MHFNPPMSHGAEMNFPLSDTRSSEPIRYASINSAVDSC